MLAEPRSSSGIDPMPPRPLARTIHIYTIGFTKKPAEVFFGKLSRDGVRRVVDVRLQNVSQLAGFTKRDDLRYFLRTICALDYVHMPILSPTKELFDAIKKHGLDWDSYERRFLEILRARKIEDTVSRDLLDGACLLCTEETPDHCHRRLVAEYLRDHWKPDVVEITHIV